LCYLPHPSHLQGKVDEFIALKVRVGGCKISHLFRDNSGAISGVMELMLLQLHQVHLRCSLPNWLGGAWRCWSSVALSMSSRFQLTSVQQKSSRWELQALTAIWGCWTPTVDVVGLLPPLSTSVGFRFHLLCWQNSFMDGGADIVVLAVFLVVVPSLRTAAKLCSTSVYTFYKALYNCFPFRSW
jgi:hypothetical protein